MEEGADKVDAGQIIGIWRGVLINNLGTDILTIPPNGIMRLFLKVMFFDVMESLLWNQSQEPM